MSQLAGDIERTIDTVVPQLANLFGRPQVPAAELDELAASVAGQRCMVTGAGGSIGSSLSSLLAEHKPEQLTLVDNHENSLFRLRARLRCTESGLGSINCVLADVRNTRAMESIIVANRPQVILHLAAYKHVPIAQDWPTPFAEVNVLAGWNLLGLAARLDVERFVYSSTDKAVRPCNVYGATKRAMELAIQAFGAAGARTGYVCARLVNVVGARGGVIETFIGQICQGQPLTITDPAMTRYWVTEDEALLLLLKSAAWRGSGSTLMLSLREPRAVQSVAQRLWDLLKEGSGPVPLHTIGARPGERLHEELIYEFERLAPTDNPSVMEARRTRETHPSLAEMAAWTSSLRLLVQDQKHDEVREALFALARDYS